MKQFKVLEVHLPAQKGCEHVHLEIEDLETKEKETIVYHMNNLKDSQEESHDEVLTFLKEIVYQEEIKTIEEFKEKVTNLEKVEIKPIELNEGKR